MVVRVLPFALLFTLQSYIHNRVKIRLDEPWVKEVPLVAGSNPAAASFYIRGPQPRDWHLGQKQVPRFCTGTRVMVLPQTGQGSPPL